MSKVLVMNCDMTNGTKKEYQITEPKSNLSLQQINAALDVCKQKHIFLVNGAEPAALLGAHYIETIRTDILE